MQHRHRHRHRRCTLLLHLPRHPLSLHSSDFTSSLTELTLVTHDHSRDFICPDIGSTIRYPSLFLRPHPLRTRSHNPTRSSYFLRPRNLPPSLPMHEMRPPSKPLALSHMRQRRLRSQTIRRRRSPWKRPRPRTLYLNETPRGSETRIYHRGGKSRYLLLYR